MSSNFDSVIIMIWVSFVMINLWLFIPEKVSLVKLIVEIGKLYKVKSDMLILGDIA